MHERQRSLVTLEGSNHSLWCLKSGGPSQTVEENQTWTVSIVRQLYSTAKGMANGKFVN